VLDPFLGSGSTLIATGKTGRRCHGVELDPLYVDVILRRYEAIAGRSAILESTGETYAARRQCEDEARPVPLSDAEKAPKQTPRPACGSRERTNPREAM
jgi:hypothetical protein